MNLWSHSCRVRLSAIVGISTRWSCIMKGDTATGVTFTTLWCSRELVISTYVHSLVRYTNARLLKTKFAKLQQCGDIRVRAPVVLDADNPAITHSICAFHLFHPDIVSLFPTMDSRCDRRRDEMRSDDEPRYLVCIALVTSFNVLSSAIMLHCVYRMTRRPDCIGTD